MSAAAAEERLSAVIGTGGHIDHGKTTLIRALTGTDTDRLPEEKRRGITIDLGFAALSLDSPDSPGDQPNRRPIDLSFIDVPGHHAFLQNMIAGAGGIDGLLLVIAADEGVRAQTREHLAICTLLGVREGVVALTRTDLVGAERLQQALAEVRAFLRGTPLARAPLVPVSARTGEGIEPLKRALAGLARPFAARSSQPVLRVPIDRAFSRPGFGTVVTGTLHEGVLRRGDALMLQPQGREVRVRGLQVHRHAAEQVRAATRVAINLSGVEVAEVRRGDVLVPAQMLLPTTVVDAEFEVWEDSPPLRHRSFVGVHAFAAESPARLLVYTPAQKPPSGQPQAQETAAPPPLVRLRLARPMVLAPGDRFVLRQPSPAKILGGGRVLDAQPDMRLRKAATQRWLESIRLLDARGQVLERVRRRGLAGITAGQLVRETGIIPDAVRSSAAEAVASGGLLAAPGERYLAVTALREAAERVLRELRSRPERSGSRAELLSKTRLAEWVFDAAIDRLAGDGLARRVGGQIAQVTTGSVDSGKTGLLGRIEELYRAAGLAAPIVEEAATKLKLHPRELVPLLTQLLRAGKLVRMGEDRLLIHASALEALRHTLRAHRGETLDVPRFKQLTGLTRKHAIPVLEYLDAQRITLNRQGIRTVL